MTAPTDMHHHHVDGVQHNVPAAEKGMHELSTVCPCGPSFQRRCLECMGHPGAQDYCPFCEAGWTEGDAEAYDIVIHQPMSGGDLHCHCIPGVTP